MTRILHIKKSKDQEMSTLREDLEKILVGIGLEKIGRIGHWEVGGPKFPSTYGFESAGEGGFVVTYEENSKVYKPGSDRDTIEVDASLVPIGATGSLVQRTYEHLTDICQNQGYATFEDKSHSA